MGFEGADRPSKRRKVFSFKLTRKQWRYPIITFEISDRSRLQLLAQKIEIVGSIRSQSNLDAKACHLKAYQRDEESNGCLVGQQVLRPAFPQN